MSAGAKGRKFDRNRKSPSMSAYNSTRRDLINKARKVAKAKKDNTPRKGTTPRGTARAKRRTGLGVGYAAK